MATQKSVNTRAVSKKPAPKEAPVRKGFPARKAGAAPARKRKPLPTYKAPADFKPHFLLVQVTTEADGLIASKVKAVRYVGRFDRDVEDKKKFDMAGYDMQTVVGIASRLGGVTYKATNEKKFPLSPAERVGFKGAARLPAKATFQILIRVGRKAADNSLTAGVKQVWQAVTSAKTGRTGLKELEKTDVCYRAFRKASRFLPAAFSNVQMPPKRTRGWKPEAEDDEG
ncbi:MAG: hypothetical protein E6R03_13245 [Hyphomicrobiaceae bacterium]|nr:MAG: hypothetical protein E6R03_13245 [Hyphomicrobiaceae bacterium]